MRNKKTILYGNVNVDAEKKVLGSKLFEEGSKNKSSNISKRVLGSKNMEEKKNKLVAAIAKEQKIPQPTKDKKTPKQSLPKPSKEVPSKDKAPIPKTKSVTESKDKSNFLKTDKNKTPSDQNKLPKPPESKKKSETQKTNLNIPTLANIEKNMTNLPSVPSPKDGVKQNFEEMDRMKKGFAGMSAAIVKSMQDLENKMNSPQPKDNFEERVTTLPHNLIFFNRSKKMSGDPLWA